VLDDVRANMRRAARALIVGFAIVAAALGYWQVLRTDLATDSRNPRIVQERLDEPRGRILDRTGQVLAVSESTPDGMRRHYAEPSMVHTLGFHSARFGDTNLEAVYDAELRGERSPSTLDRLLAQVVHRPARPSDLVLTADARVHDAAIAALGNSSGAIVAHDPRSARALAGRAQCADVQSGRPGHVRPRLDLQNGHRLSCR
jgi:cell division protein FtsI/penicillin-binding protein 2